MLGSIGAFGVTFGILGFFTGEFGISFLFIIIGALLLWCQSSIDKDNQQRHEQDYGKVARCYKCGSTRVYYMTYDDKRDSINFWGAASSKIGKRYHCDDCGTEW